MALFRRPSTPTQPEPAPAPTVSAPGSVRPQPVRKDKPTPSRRDAEAARRQRINRTLTPKEARRESSRQNRSARMKALAAREATPEKELMRDHVDARFSLGEFLMPALIIILALSFLSPVVPNIAVISTVLMYVYILAVFADGFVMWRGFKKLMAQRLPKVPLKGSGLLFYGMNRVIQFRRFRMPAPRIKRGQSY